MTTPASGAISTGDLNVEKGSIATAQIDFSWLSTANIKSYTGGTVLGNSQLYNKGYYQKNNAYFNCTMDNRDAQCNCNNCNCACSQCNNCGSYNCQTSQCTSYGACSNCACDTKAWLQANCNCGDFQNCTYNCTLNLCNCNCRC